MPIGEFFKLIPVFIDQHRDLSAIAFGAVVAGITGLAGLLLRLPLQRQAVANDTFRTQREGYEGLIERQAEHIAYLESQARLRDDYEAELIRQLRECQMARLQEKR